MANARQKSQLDLLSASKNLVKALKENPQGVKLIKNAAQQSRPLELVSDNKDSSSLNYGLISLLTAIIIKVFH